MIRKEVDRKKLTPMMLQYMEIKDKYVDEILFFRLGDFYEMFFEDGLLAAKELEIALTGKSAGLDERIPMCGIPFHSANAYIEKLINKGYKVAICEQVEEASKAKKLVKRDVVRIVTPGSLIDEYSLDDSVNNYIANIVEYDLYYGISYADISTGEINVMFIEKDSEQLIQELLKQSIKEVVVTHDFDSSVIGSLQNSFNIVVSFIDGVSSNNYDSLFEEIDDQRCKYVVLHLIKYLEKTQQKQIDHFQKVNLLNKLSYMKFDLYVEKNLELIETLRTNERSGTLLSVLDKTKTAMGSRLLKQWIRRPLYDKSEITKRYDHVDSILADFIIHDELRTILDKVYDIERLAGRLAFSNANPKDLSQLRSTLSVLPDVKNIINNLDLVYDIPLFTDLYNLLNNSILENPSFTLKDGGIIKEGFNDELDELRLAKKNGKDWLLLFEQREREKTGIKNLKIGYNRVFGYYIEITKSNTHLVLDEFGYDRKQTLSNAERYITDELKEMESKILGAEEKSIRLEYDLFISIREKAKASIKELQDVSKVISEIDCLQSFATVASKNRYVRPIIADNHEIKIINGRHPSLELVLRNDYISNSLVMDEDTDIYLITGPNMAGKSTYMRQNALIVIMAQIGCFVPADAAKIPLFDRIFTRIGASDDLTRGQSTFMIEMIEANNAVTNATKNSLILFDEIGRGTATYDGMSLAHALIEYIHDKIGAKTLFSTHYHEMVTLEEELPRLKNVHVSAELNGDELIFLHQIKEGYIDRSYGINVAKLAHLPNAVIERAKTVLETFESVEHTYQPSLDLFANEVVDDSNSKIIEEIKELDPLGMTPLDALNYLFELKKKL